MHRVGEASPNMPGIVGGTVSDSALSSMADSIEHEGWYETELFAGDRAGIGIVHHGEKDQGGHETWEGAEGAGVIYGAVSNIAELGLSTDELFRGLLDRPSVVLPKLDGPFFIAALDERDGSIVAATDKLGTRSGFYAPTPEGIAVGSEVKAVATQLDEVTLDVSAAADLLAFGFVVGEKTLASEVQALQPATMLRYADDELSVERYWEPMLGRLPVDGYVERSVEVYRNALSNTASTLSGRVGLYLSGGLDSRTMATVLREEIGPFRTFTYDMNPSDGTNIEPARHIADLLGIDNEVTDIVPGDFRHNMEYGVALTDGCNSWSYYVNPEFVFGDLHRKVDVVMEAAPQGELFGEDIWLSQLQTNSSTETLFDNYAHLGAEEVSAILTEDIDPRRSMYEEVAKSDHSQPAKQIMDAFFRNFCSNSHFRSNKISRSQVGTRIPFASGEFLDHVASMPHEHFRRDTFPGTRGKIPRSMAPLKREIVRELDSGIEDIMYERTLLAPSRPLWIQDASYVAKQLYWKFVTGRPARWAEWSRERPEMRNTLNEWLDNAAGRPVFDEGAIRDIQDEHFRGGKNRLRAISAITTIEMWMRQQLPSMRQQRP